MLAEAAGRIAAEARAIDSVGRIGGEEFAWLLPDASAAETLAAAERLRAAVRSRPFAQGLTLTASIGICDLACAPAPEQLLERADQALYWAKTTGRAWPPPAVGSASSARRARTSTRQARLHRAARVHDAGKALLSTDVLRRPGPLSTLESAHVRQHATLGAALARGALDAEQVRWVRHHHERWDGAGYPTGRPAKTSPAAPGSWRSPTPGTP